MRWWWQEPDPRDGLIEAFVWALENRPDDFDCGSYRLQDRLLPVAQTQWAG